MKKRLALCVCVVTAFAMILGGCGKKTGDSGEAANESSSVEAAATASTEEVASVEATSAPESLDPITLEDAITAAIFEKGADYRQGEVAGEGHIIMGQEEVSNQVICYLLTMYGSYEFENGNFVKCAGSGAIPAVLTFTVNDGVYELLYYNEPVDGSGFVDSVKDLFPESLWSRCITIEEDDMIELTRQERADAEEYLGTIGREDAEIGDYADFEYLIDSDYKISDEVSNKIAEYQVDDPIAQNCDFWYGDREVLEENVRYIYRKEYDKKQNQVIFSKILYETEEVIEISAYSSKTGEPVG
ncbi:hypothetical protein [Butyrivibrio proteoclasticus]|uniref:hypothetical protein n=1 Tax=Butyrivibrio proteoclasticus TaxID=43305 RepID=UPI000553BE59|nr:hypothetical protein [Butyrivibrio proteoclasticus]